MGTFSKVQWRFSSEKKSVAVGDNQSEVASAGLVDAGKINFIENAMTEREPNPAVQIECGADAGLGARSPARCDSGPSRRITNIIAHKALSSRLSSLPEVSDLRSPSTRNMGRWHLIEHTCWDSALVDFSDFRELVRLEKMVAAKCLGNQAAFIGNSFCCNLPLIFCP